MIDLTVEWQALAFVVGFVGFVCGAGWVVSRAIEAAMPRVEDLLATCCAIVGAAREGKVRRGR